MIDELIQYHTDHEAWLKQAGVKFASKVPAMNDDDLAREWSSITRAYQRAVWSNLDSTQQDRIKLLRGAA